MDTERLKLNLITSKVTAANRMFLLRCRDLIRVLFRFGRVYLQICRPNRICQAKDGTALPEITVNSTRRWITKSTSALRSDSQ